MSKEPSGASSWFWCIVSSVNIAIDGFIVWTRESVELENSTGATGPGERAGAGGMVAFKGVGPL